MRVVFMKGKTFGDTTDGIIQPIKISVVVTVKYELDLALRTYAD